MAENKINMKRHSFDDITYFDDALHQLAMYEVAQGLILVPKTPEAVAELHVKFANKFNEFKRLIQSGECTYEFIKFTVLDKNGPFPPTHNIPNVEDIEVWDKIEKEWAEEDLKNDGKSKNFIDSFLDGFMSGANKDGITVHPLDELEEYDRLQEEKKIPPKFSIKAEQEKQKAKKKKQPPKKDI